MPHFGEILGWRHAVALTWNPSAAETASRASCGAFSLTGQRLPEVAACLLARPVLKHMRAPVPQSDRPAPTARRGAPQPVCAVLKTPGHLLRQQVM